MLLLLTSCVTEKTIYKNHCPIQESDFPDFPELNFYDESLDGNYITVDSLWFVAVADFKLRIDDLKLIVKKIQEDDK